MKNQLIILMLFFLVVSMTTCKSTPEPETLRTTPTLKVLFIGNSLTYTNDIPSLVKELGKHDNVEIAFETILLPNYSLEDHWNDGQAQKIVKAGKFDFVVAQQGPSALPESQVLLLQYATLFADLCKQHNTKFALYMVWPSANRLFDLDNVIYSYTQAALKTNSMLCPAGLAWKYAWQIDSQLPLYSSDNFHPSPTGSVLSALAIYGSLRMKENLDFIMYDKSSWSGSISEDRFQKLKEAAGKAIHQ